MPLLDVNKEADLFEQRVRSGFYGTERSQNSEVNYAKEKENRDSKAVKEFTKTRTFAYIKNMR